MRLEYFINDFVKTINVPDKENFVFGENVTLSNENNDVTYKFDWYDNGYTVKKFLNDEEFLFIKTGIENSIKKIINKTINKEIDAFNLEEYHEIINSDEEHYKIVSQTRDLFNKDFSFDINYLIPKLEKVLGIKITDYDEINNYKAHIIVRINRPFSSDFNPPHKDIYEHFDDEGYVPKFINFWIPICGVTKNSTLPMAPKSHLIPENKILRTIDGSIVNDNKYRVRLIKSWGDENKFTRPIVNYSEVLIFSPHLIHGLAYNEEPNLTRVALEFRLYEKN